MKQLNAGQDWQERIENIQNMNEGKEGYTVPWALAVDTEGNVWINGKFRYYENSGGTVTLKFVRTKEGARVFSFSFDKLTEKTKEGLWLPVFL